MESALILLVGAILLVGLFYYLVRRANVEVEFRLNHALGCLVVAGAGIATIAIVLYIRSSDSGMRTGPSRPDHRTAYETCETLVKERLRAPSTAEFGGYGQANIERSGGETYRIEGWVDAENAFGAMLRNTFVCSHDADSRTVRLLSVTAR